MCISSLQEICTEYVARHFLIFDINRVKVLPFPTLQSLIPLLSPLNLRRLEVALDTPKDVHQGIWMAHYAKNFAINYRRMFKVTETNDNLFCVVKRTNGDYRTKFMEDHFHILLEDANKIAILLERGVREVNVYRDDEPNSGNGKAGCDVKLEEIKSSMMLCAPFVKSLRIFRTKVLMSPLLQEVLHLLTKTVVCIRLVFLHDYYLLRETLAYFVKNANILDLHTVWQPQRSSLPSKYPVEILSLLAGLQLPQVSGVEPDGESTKMDDDLIAWNPYDLYDIAVSGPRLGLQQADDNLTFECAAAQSEKAATHVSISSFLLTQQPSVHRFIANTLMDRWTSLRSFKLACQYQVNMEVFLPTILKLIAQRNLRSLCFEDTQIENPMILFKKLLTILIRHEDIVMDRVTLLGIGHPFYGDFTAEIIKAGYFRGITALDLSFSSLNNVKSLPTFYEYIKRDKALRFLNLNCCKLSPDESTAKLLQSIGMSEIQELIMDFNPITGQAMEDAMIEMVENNTHFQTLSCSLCDFSQSYLRNRLLPALANLTKLDRLFLAENRIGCEPALKELIMKMLRNRKRIGYLDLSSNILSGVFLCELLQSLKTISSQGFLFKGLNLSFNMDDSDDPMTREYVREQFPLFCENFLCMVVHEDGGAMARMEHLAQM